MKGHRDVGLRLTGWKFWTSGAKVEWKEGTGRGLTSNIKVYLDLASAVHSLHSKFVISNSGDDVLFYVPMAFLEFPICCARYDMD
jgi:hypothetical protein